MLWEAYRGNTVDSDSQNGDDQMDKCDPVGEERPEKLRRTIAVSGIDKNSKYFLHKLKWISCLPMIVHVLNLPLDKAINALAVRPVCKSTDYAEPIRPLLPRKQLLNRNHDPLSPLLMAAHTHNLLFQTYFRLDLRTIFSLPPSSLQRPELRNKKAVERITN